MNAFVARHQEQVVGALSGFDRLLFRGTLRSIAFVQGAEVFLRTQHILLKDFAAFAEQCTEDLVAHAKHVAADAGRPYIYLPASSVRKEVFRDRAALEHLYPGLWQHALRHFSSPDVMRFLRKRLTSSFAGEAQTKLDRWSEGVRIKHTINGNAIKMYDKAETMLRIETTVNNPRWFRVPREVPGTDGPTVAWRHMRMGVSDIERRVEISRAANERYLEALAVVGEETPSHRILDAVSTRVHKRGQAYRPLRPITPEEGRLFAAILHGEHLLDGFRNVDLCAHLFPGASPGEAQRRKRTAKICRAIRLLRAHGLIRKVPHRRLYRITSKGHCTMTTALLVRQTDLALLKRSTAT